MASFDLKNLELLEVFYFNGRVIKFWPKIYVALKPKPGTSNALMFLELRTSWWLKMKNCGELDANN